MLRVRSLTDAQGHFHADHLPAGRYRISARRRGCSAVREFELADASEERARQWLVCEGDEPTGFSR